MIRFWSWCCFWWLLGRFPFPFSFASFFLFIYLRVGCGVGGIEQWPITCLFVCLMSCTLLFLEFTSNFLWMNVKYIICGKSETLMSNEIMANTQISKHFSTPLYASLKILLLKRLIMNAFKIGPLLRSYVQFLMIPRPNK